MAKLPGTRFVQDNESISRKGVLRGLHFQKPPFAQGKLVRVPYGRALDVVVDLRTNSKTYGKHYTVEISAANHKMLWVPEGFAHGFQALSDDCELIYHHSQFYTPGAEGGIKYNDTKVKVYWPLPVTNISERDNRHELLNDNFKGI